MIVPVGGVSQDSQAPAAQRPERAATGPIAYLINQYPQPSQSFIRREIAALEQLGQPVLRYTLRRFKGTLVDQRDIEESQRVRAVLDVGGVGLCLAMLATFFGRPRRFLAAARLTWRVGQRSDRGLLVNVIYLAEACVLLKWFAAERVRHVHAHFGSNSTAVAMLCRELGGPPYSFTAHGPEEFDRPRELWLGEKVARSKFAIAISQFGRSQLYRWTPYEHWAKVHVVHCGLDDSFLNVAPTTPPDAPRLVCVGRLEEQKGTLLLLEAAALLVAEGLRFELTLIGDGRMRGEVERLISRFGLEDTVRLAGWQSNAAVRAEIVRSRALVLPSFAEGLPVVIMESLALSRPVISTYVGGIAELVRPNECGWLAPAGAAAPLADLMREVLSADPEYLAQLGAIGAARVQSRHRATTEAARLLLLFEGLPLQQRPRGEGEPPQVFTAVKHAYSPVATMN